MTVTPPRLTSLERVTYWASHAAGRTRVSYCIARWTDNTDRKVSEHEARTLAQSHGVPIVDYKKGRLV